MNHFRIKWMRLPFLLFAFLYLLINFYAFYIAIIKDYNIDIKEHLFMLQSSISSSTIPIPPLYYESVYFFHLITGLSVGAGAIFVLSSAAALKYYFSHQLLPTNSDKRVEIIKNLLLFIVLVMTPIAIPFGVDVRWFVGKFGSTLYHNSTLIFVFPFSLKLFVDSLKFPSNVSFRSSFGLIVLGLLVALAKPSFLFPFIIVFPLYVFWSFKNINKAVVVSLSISLIILTVILVEKYFIYSGANWIYNTDTSAKVVLAPFQVWRILSHNMPLSFATSFILLFYILIFYSDLTIKKLNFQYALTLLVVSLLIFFLLAETGKRLPHGNFFWQIPISVLICYLIFLRNILNESNFQIKGLRFYFLQLILLLYFVSGILYYVRFVFLGYYK